MERSTIEKVKGFGFDVYMRNTDDSWLLFTDGKRIGCLGEARFGGYSLTTVHKPNARTGTGFSIADGVADFSKADLLHCLTVVAPGWWQPFRDEALPVKWASIDAYLADNSFNRAYRKI